MQIYIAGFISSPGMYSILQVYMFKMIVDV